MRPVFYIVSQLRSRAGFFLSGFRSRHRLHKTLIWACLLVFGFTMTSVFANEPPTSPSIHNGAAHQREFRGVWAATVANIDWPSQPGLSVSQQQAELIGVLDRMQELNLNALILQVRPAGDAFYASELEPWSYWLTGQQGQAPQPFYDPLEFAIAESHKRNIELHAWFNPYRAQNASQYTLAANHMAREFPQYAYNYGDLVWMDPGAREVQDKTYQVILDVVRRYDVDGIHLDDYFYPYPQGGMDFPDDATYNAYRRHGGTLALDDWRRDNVNQLVQRLFQGIRELKPHVKFGISPFGIYRPGQPAGVDGMDQYAEIYADPKLWLEQGWVDYMAPQLYWRISAPEQSYPALLGWWVANNPRRRHIYTGNYLSQLDGAGWPVSEFEDQVVLSRKSANNLSLGNIFFSMKMFSRNSQGVNDAFKSSLYSLPALTPTMEWLDNQPPNPPSGLQATAGELSWDGDRSGDVRSWTLYRKQGNTWRLEKVLNAQTTRWRVSAGTYGLCAVDALSNESSTAAIDVR